MLKNIVVLCVIPILNTKGVSYGNPFSGWSGQWFPHHPDEEDPNQVVEASGKVDLYDAHHGVLMGVEDKDCDDGKTNLEIDWNQDPANYTCYEVNKKLFYPNARIHPIHSVEHVPTKYNAPHKCMNETIQYNEVIPTFGTHRPLWPKYGEYTFVPKQRWLHSLEHGAVVLLYHPCANKNQVNLLKKLVASCLYRHVITPYNLLTPERPLALVTWGHRLEMSKVAPEVVVDFIKSFALNGPEKTSRDGQYSVMLEKHAQIVSTIDDEKLCPKFRSGINMK